MLALRKALPALIALTLFVTLTSQQWGVDDVWLPPIEAVSDTNGNFLPDELESPETTNFQVHLLGASRAHPFAMAYPQPLPRDSSLHLIVTGSTDSATGCAHLAMPSGHLLVVRPLEFRPYAHASVTFPPVGAVEADFLRLSIFTNTAILTDSVPLQR